MNNEPMSFFNGPETHIMNGVSTVNNNVVGGNQLLQSQIQSLGKQMEAGLQQLNNKMESYTTERKRLMNRQLVCCSDGTMSVVQIMSDGSQTSIPFITSSVGMFMIADLFVDVISPWADYYILSFEHTNIQIVGQKKKFSGKQLYEKMIEVGIKFAPELRKTFIMDVLFEALAEQISNPTRRILISSRAGWDQGIFRDFANFPLKTPDHARLPVYEKYFHRRVSTVKDYARYFSELQKIADWRNRMLFIIPLFAGLLASLLRDITRVTLPIWNFIMMIDVPDNQVVSWLQIYNRQRQCWKIHEMDITTKRLNKLLAESKDEVLIGDFRSIPTETPYKLHKKQELLRVIQKRLELERLPLVFAAISDTIVPGRNILNVFIDQDFFQTEDKDCWEASTFLDAVMTDFVSYVERNFGAVKKEIEVLALDGTSDFVGMEIVWQIVIKFFSAHNQNVYEELEIPADFSWNSLTETTEWNEEEILDLFVWGFRRAVGGIYFKERRYGQAFEVETTILHDETYLWIPVNIWNKTLKECGLDSYKHRILMELKEGCYMKTDATGYSRKIHSGHQSHEVYQVSKNIFNRPGYSDITSCGKEE